MGKHSKCESSKLKSARPETRIPSSSRAGLRARRRRTLRLPSSNCQVSGFWPGSCGLSTWRHVVPSLDGHGAQSASLPCVRPGCHRRPRLDRESESTIQPVMCRGPKLLPPRREDPNFNGLFLAMEPSLSVDKISYGVLIPTKINR